MASLTQLPSGNWRVQVRRKNRYVSETFRRRKEALGALKLPKLNREPLIEFGRQRAKEGAGRATLAIDFSFIRPVATHAAAVHGIEVSAEEVRLARYAMKHLGLVAKSEERDRRPTEDELGELIEYFATHPRQVIPMGRIVRYAVATTMRQEEIGHPDWPDVDMKTRVLIIRDRKNPRAKDGNDQKVPLLNLTETQLMKKGQWSSTAAMAHYLHDDDEAIPNG